MFPIPASAILEKLSEQAVERIQSVDQFMPHGGCFQWDTHLLAVLAFSDFVIGLALCWLAVRRDTWRSPNGVSFLFRTAFFIAGLVHFVMIYNLWGTLYYLEGYLKLIDAAFVVMAFRFIAKTRSHIWIEPYGAVPPHLIIRVKQHLEENEKNETEGG